MDEVFGTVLIAVCVIAIVIALVSYAGSGGLYRGIGRSGAFALDEQDERRHEPHGAGSQAEAHQEIRQMLEAKSHRRVRRGQEPLDVEAEMAALLSGPGDDAALREEVRQHVLARNARRARRGEEPLDVEAEIDRQLRELPG